MSCILKVSGQDLDVDAFLNKSGLDAYKKSYKGQPRLKTKPNGEKLLQSSFAVETSAADSNYLDKQIADTITYLRTNQDKLKYISLTKEVQYAVLDFAIDLRIDKRKVLTQSDKFPHELLKLAGDLSLDIELSIYPLDLQKISDDSSKTDKSA